MKNEEQKALCSANLYSAFKDTGSQTGFPAVIQKGIQSPGRAAAVVYKADGPFPDGRIQGKLNKPPLFQIFFDKFFNDTADSKADSCKFNQQIHGRYLQIIVDCNLVKRHIVINIIPGNIILIQQHNISGLEYVGISSFSEAEIFQIRGRGGENILNLCNRNKDDIFLRLWFCHQPQVDSLLLQLGQGMGGGLVFNGDLDMRIPFDKALQIIDHNKAAQGIADSDVDVAEIKFPDALELLFADGKLLEGSPGMFKQHLSFLCQLYSSGITGKKRGMQAVFQFADRFADGRLADVKLLGSPGNISGHGYGIKNTILG